MNEPPRKKLHLIKKTPKKQIPILKRKQSLDIEKNNKPNDEQLLELDSLSIKSSIDYKVGTAGFYYKWWFGMKGNQLNLPSYYPVGLAESRALTYYAEEFSIVELNNTFYKLPTAVAVKEWYRKTPSNFKFIVKLGKFITQDKKLIDFPNLFNEFWFDRVEHLKDKCAGILVQMPPSFVYNPNKKGVDGLTTFERLRNAGLYIKSLNNDNKFNIPIFIEFRDPSWFVGKVYELLSEIGWSFVVVHINNQLNELGKMNSGFSPQLDDIPITLGDHIYFRFHGTWPIAYHGGYTSEELTMVYNWAKSHNIKNGYFIFNNTDSFEGEICSELTISKIPGKIMVDPDVLNYLGAIIPHAIFNARQMNFIINTDIVNSEI